MPSHHNTASKFEKRFDDKDKKVTTINHQNEECYPTLVAIHEASPGSNDNSMPTKPEKDKRGIYHYEKLIRNGTKGTIGYHAMITSKGLFEQPEIVLYLPATASPDQVGNSAYAKHVYGMERLCGEEQNYHLAIENQAMLTAFVLKEIGYSIEEAMLHFFPHNFFAKNNKKCPARMLYATELIKKGDKLSEEEKAILREYVPYEVFRNLVRYFFERDKYPEELRRKFIMDASDREAYENNPDSYNYEERKKLKTKQKSTYDILKNPKATTLFNDEVLREYSINKILNSMSSDRERD